MWLVSWGEGLAQDAKPTDEPRVVFLQVLRETGNVSEAARCAGVARTTPYAWRDEDESYARSWADAEAEATDALEAEARRRAKDGWLEPVFYQGEQCGEVRKYSDTMLSLLLKAHSPKFRDSVKIDANVTGRIDPPEVPDSAERDGQVARVLAGDREDASAEGAA